MGFKTLILSIILAFSVSMQAQIRYEEGQYWSRWSDSSSITLLQARLGSRFSFSLSTFHKAIYQGSLGMDNDNFSQWLCGVEVNGDRFRFPTSSSPARFKPFSVPEYGMNCLSTGLRGEASGLRLEWIQESAWEPFASVADTNRLKFNTAPFYTWRLKIRNQKPESVKAIVYLGQNSVPVDPDKGVNLSWWRINTVCHRIYFRDPSGKGGLMALSAPDGLKPVLFEDHGFYGLKLEVTLPPNGEAEFPLVWAGHLPEPVLQDEKHNQSLRFAYNAFFRTVDEVSDYGLKNLFTTRSSVEKFHLEVAALKGNAEEKWLAALTFRTDIANGLLLRDPAGKLRWYETEGRFRHMNTLDVAFETQILARWTPWRLRMMLEQWAGYIALFEEWVPSSRSRSGVRENREGVSASETGPFVYHDVGNFPFVMNAEGYDFGPYLPVEENATFIQLLYFYWRISDDKEFVRKYAGLVAVLLQSLQNRDSNGNGLADVGHGWTTYDVSDAVKRAPDNAYSGVKMMVAYLLGAELLKQSEVKAIRPVYQELKSKDQDGTTLNGNQKAEWEKGTISNGFLRARQVRQFEAEASRILVSLAEAKKKHGFIPVSLDTRFPGWDQKVTVLGEGLLYPILTGFEHPTLTGLKKLLRPEWEKALPLCTRPYGLVISSSEPTTWFSKTMVIDFVASKAFGFQGSHSHYVFRWNANNEQAYQDGANSLTEPWPGNWYPRGLSAWLYLLR